MTPEAALYAVPGVAVTIANTPIEFPPGQHAHEQYEFVGSLSEDMSACLDGAGIVMQKQQMMPINPWQRHGVKQTTQVARFISIMCERPFLQELSIQAFGQAEVIFQNIGFSITNKVRLLLGQLVDESISQLPGHQVMRHSLVTMLLLEVIRHSENNVRGVVEVNPEQAALNRAASYLQQQFARPITVESAALMAGLSPSHFIRAFKRHTGKTPHSYLRDIRIEQASARLRDKSQRITEVALACGFANSSHFSTVFKRVMGISPSDYRRTLL